MQLLELHFFIPDIKLMYTLISGSDIKRLPKNSLNTTSTSRRLPQESYVSSFSNTHQATDSLVLSP